MASSPNGTSFYNADYFQQSCGKPYARTDEWLQFFAGIAEKIAEEISPERVLDAGCAMGFLVEGLRAQGVEAYGIDISDYAIQHVREDLRPYCQVRSILEPLSDRYDLVVCIEVLEHLPLVEGEKAIANLCQATEDILFSSTPFDYRELSHFNIQPPEYWAERFALHGFVRDIDFDATFITPWAVRFRRNHEPQPRLLRNYERRFWRLWQENQDLRKLALEMKGRIIALEAAQTKLVEMTSRPSPRMSTRPISQSPILVISHDVVGAYMAGPGIRYYHLARVLSQEFNVILAVPQGSDLIPATDFQILIYDSWQDPLLIELLKQARAILAPASAVGMLPALAHSLAPVILDGYDPFLAETLFLQKAETSEQLTALSLGYLAGDFFLCASERQRDWWLGLLEASGRINIYTYNEDASLRRLVDLVPFGLPETAPQHTRFVVKGVWPNINRTDRVILWGGGLWPWLDPLTAIRAFAKIWQHRQDIRLIFPGTQRPNPALAEIPTYNEAARELASDYHLLDKGIFFGDWIAYQDWPNVLLESDLALTLHGKETLESRLAFRSRVLDYFWAHLPVVATAGDVTSDLIADHQVGQVIQSGDEDAVAQAILQLLDTPRETFDARFEKLCASLTWERAARPLIEFCRQPRRAPDKVALGEKLGLPRYYQIQALQQRLAEREAHIFKLEQRLIDRVVRWLSLRLPPRSS